MRNIEYRSRKRGRRSVVAQPDSASAYGILPFRHISGSLREIFQNPFQGYKRDRPIVFLTMRLIRKKKKTIFKLIIYERLLERQNSRANYCQLFRWIIYPLIKSTCSINALSNFQHAAC